MSGNLDSKVIPDSDINGLMWRVTVDYDEFLTEPEGDCYTPAQVKTFKAGEWYYVIVGVTPIVAGVELEELEDTLAGVEYGTFTCTDEDDNVTRVAEISLGHWAGEACGNCLNYPVPDMISEAKSRLAGMAPVFAEVFGQVRSSERETAGVS